MPEQWLPGAERILPSAPGGTPLRSNPPRVVWHTTESDAGDAAFAAVAKYLRSKGSEPHLLWDPTTGRVGQFFPADTSARALANAGDVRTNRTGLVTIQIEVLGRAKDTPLKTGPCIGLDKILLWLDSWGISREWPGGFPPASPGSYGLDNGHRDMDTWITKGGQFSHSQVPGNTHSDPGLIDPAKWIKPVIPPKPSVSLANVIDAAKRDPKAPQGATTHKRDVLLVEYALQDERLLSPGYVDGSFGSLTKKAYAGWQRRLGYSGAGADGIPGKASLTALGKKHGFTVVA